MKDEGWRQDVLHPSRIPSSIGSRHPPTFILHPTMSDLAELERRALDELQACPDEAAVRAWHGRYLGDKGAVPEALKKIGTLPQAERKGYGQKANQVKDALKQAHDAAALKKKEEALERSLAAEKLDVTLPGREVPRGRLHPSTRTLRAIYEIFAELGFQIYRSPDVEDD